MTDWYFPLMIDKSADPTIHEGASLKKMLNLVETLNLSRQQRYERDTC